MSSRRSNRCRHDVVMTSLTTFQQLLLGTERFNSKSEFVTVSQLSCGNIIYIYIYNILKYLKEEMWFEYTIYKDHLSTKDPIKTKNGAMI